MRRHLVSIFSIVLLWWSTYSLIFATQVVSMGEQQGNPVAWGEALRYSFAGWMTWIPLSLALYALVVRFPIGRRHASTSALILLAGVLGAVLLRAGYVYLTNPIFGWYPVLPDFGSVVLSSMRNNLMLGLAVVGVAHALVFHRQARERENRVVELEAHLAQTRLEALRAQLHPHFLFNALNSVAEMVHKDASLADRMLVSLSALLRNGLSTDQMQLRPLRDELALVRHYLTIEEIRLGDRLQVDWEIDDHCLDVAVPTLVLQPLVENAVVHGIAPRREPGRIGIVVRLVLPDLALSVVNTVGPQTSTTAGTGIGLRSIVDRLSLLYPGSETRMRWATSNGLFAVEARIPADLQKSRELESAVST